MLQNYTTHLSHASNSENVHCLTNRVCRWPRTFEESTDFRGSEGTRSKIAVPWGMKLLHGGAMTFLPFGGILASTAAHPQDERDVAC